MNYRGTLIVVSDCQKAFEFYRDMFGFTLIQMSEKVKAKAPKNIK